VEGGRVGMRQDRVNEGLDGEGMGGGGGGWPRNWGKGGG